MELDFCRILEKILKDILENVRTVAQNEFIFHPFSVFFFLYSSSLLTITWLYALWEFKIVKLIILLKKKTSQCLPNMENRQLNYFFILLTHSLSCSFLSSVFFGEKKKLLSFLSVTIFCVVFFFLEEISFFFLMECTWEKSKDCLNNSTKCVNCLNNNKNVNNSSHCNRQPENLRVLISF